jgi:hypothetical protein
MSYVTAESRVEWLPHGRAFTRSDLDAMPEDGNRYGLIDGALIVTPAPSMRHQITVVSLIARLAPLCPPHLRLLVAPFDVDLAPNTVIQPDVLIAEKESPHRTRPQRTTCARRRGDLAEHNAHRSRLQAGTL